MKLRLDLVHFAPTLDKILNSLQGIDFAVFETLAVMEQEPRIVLGRDFAIDISLPW